MISLRYLLGNKLKRKILTYRLRGMQHQWITEWQAPERWR